MNSLRIFCRIDAPEGKLYEYHPEISLNKAKMHRFSDICFEPGSPANAKLKENIYRIMEETEQNRYE